MRIRASLLVLSLAALGACATSNGPRTPYGRFMQAAANPGKVVATELAFARAAQEDGQWTAFAEYAADGALLFGRNGAIEAKPWLSTQQDPAQAVEWEPHRVWSSCDGSMAVTQGAFRAPDGEVGTFNTVWQRQADGEYRYVFDFGVPQDAAPAKPEMIVSAVADCDKRLPAPAVDPGARVSTSRDGTLAWSFQLVDQGERRYDVWIAREAGWQQVLDVTIPHE